MQNQIVSEDRTSFLIPRSTIRIMRRGLNFTSISATGQLAVQRPQAKQTLMFSPPGSLATSYLNLVSSSLKATVIFASLIPTQGRYATVVRQLPVCRELFPPVR